MYGISRSRFCFLQMTFDIVTSWILHCCLLLRLKSPQQAYVHAASQRSVQRAPRNLPLYKRHTGDHLDNVGLNWQHVWAVWLLCSIVVMWHSGWWCRCQVKSTIDAVRYLADFEDRFEHACNGARSSMCRYRCACACASLPTPFSVDPSPAKPWKVSSSNYRIHWPIY